MYQRVSPFTGSLVGIRRQLAVAVGMPSDFVVVVVACHWIACIEGVVVAVVADSILPMRGSQLVGKLVVSWRSCPAWAVVVVVVVVEEEDIGHWGVVGSSWDSYLAVVVGWG